MAKENFFSDNEDILFNFAKLDFTEIYKNLDPVHKEIVSAESPEDYKKTWYELLESAGSLLGKEIAKNALKIDASPLILKDDVVTSPKELEENIAKMLELGVAPLTVTPHYGGMGFDYFLALLAGEMVNKACPSTLMSVIWYGSIAEVLEKFASEELKSEYIPKLASGEYSGSMALTEADTGSDLAAIRTYCEKQPDGSYKVFGNKRFITNGASQVCLMLAKSEKGAVGLDKISMLLCPRILDGKPNYKVNKLEEKMAMHGSATCELYFDGSKAFLIGEENMGYRYMLHLMNSSRIGTAFQAVGSMDACLELAQDFAKERKTWGKPIAHHELIAEKLLDMETELQAFRSLSYRCGYFLCLATLKEKAIESPDLSAKERDKLRHELVQHARELRRLTPLVKYWAGERAPEFARQAMLIMGGSGFIKESKVEFWLRESQIYGIYEGTSQMQALMCLKDTFKHVMSRPRDFIDELVGSTYSRLSLVDPTQRKLSTIKHHVAQATLSILLRVTASNLKQSVSQSLESDVMSMIKALTKIKAKKLVNFKNFRPALIHAERLIQMKCYEALAEELVNNAQLDPARKMFADRFLHIATNKVVALRDLITNDDPVLYEVLAANDPQKPKTEKKSLRLLPKINLASLFSN